MKRVLLAATLTIACQTSATNGPTDAGGGSQGNGGSGSGGSGGGNVENPSGDCTAPDDGGRANYHFPDANSVWLPDCNGSLTTDYFRVFVQDTGKAYMIPRPDGSPYLSDVCANPDHELHPLVEQYPLCESASASSVDLVNSMDPAAALTLAHYLNDRLVFVAGAEGVFPYALPSDILLACQEDDAFRNGPLKERCDFEIECAEGGNCPSIGWTHTGAQGVALATKMNELYGITGEELCTRLIRDARETLDDTIRHSNLSCQMDEDCTEIGRNSDCHDSCGAVAAASAQSAIDESRAAINASTCAAFEAAVCTPVVPPPCLPSVASCVDGVCVEN